MGPAAIRAVLGLGRRDRAALAAALRTELEDGPNASAEVWIDADMGAGACRYKGTPLTFGAYVAIHRPMTDDELHRLAQEDRRHVAATGFYVLELLSPAGAFTRGPRLVGHAQT